MQNVPPTHVTTNAATLVIQLENITRHWHDVVDQPWLDLLREDVTRSDYAAVLLRMYGFEAPLESACAYTPQLARVLETRQLTRAGLLAQDLLSMNVTPAELAALPQCFSITTFRDVPEALGWLYVVERSTLRHEHVRRHLLNRVAGIEQACTYLSMFDNRDEAWRRFGRTLDRVATRRETATQILDAAHAAFACMQQWFRSPASKLQGTG